MKAYIYEFTRNNKDFICSKFDNSKERVNILHQKGGIYQQYWSEGNVEYGPISGDIQTSITSNSVVESQNNVGDIIAHVWRPGLCLDIPQALQIDEGEKARAKRELKILIEKLHEILMYIEPSSTCLQSYGHKIRELLILSCTEIENSWTSYIRLSGNTSSRLSTNDFVMLAPKLFLSEYKVVFTNHPTKINLKPFNKWNYLNPTSSLLWYDAYNKTKHDKENHFDKATLENCLNAIAANLIMFCVRYSPYEMFEDQDICSKLIGEYFALELEAPDISSFYIPYLKSVELYTGAISGPKGSAFEQNWNIIKFTL